MLGFVFLLLSCLLIVNTHPLLSHAHDTLDQNQSIKDGQSLVSSGDIFELGFFSPGNSTFRYVGIWYRNISTQTVVWVANRQAPITGFNGSLTIKSDGNMVVLNGSGSSVWSTNSSTESKNFTAQLMDSGNFVLQESDGTVLWESFDYPTDTFVPGMKILRDSKKGMNQNQILTSWRSPNDPSIGEYSLGLDHRGSAQFFIWQGTAPRWRSGQWNGETFIGTMIRPLYMYGFRLTNDVSDGIMYFTFTPFNTSLLRFVLQENGVERTSMLVEGNQWESVWTQPLNECDIYGKCGDNAVCVYKNAATCNCLRGFEPKSKDEWGRGNWSAGCVRRTPLQCQSNASSSVGGEADGFFAIQGVKVPDLSDWASTVENEAGCQYACLNNCSCKAYAFPSGIGCLIWSHDLIDMYQFAQGGSVLNLKLAASELGSNHKTWKIIVAILCTLGVASLIICLFFWWKYNARIKNWWKKRGKGESLSNTDFLSGPNVDGDEGRSSELPFYRFDQLATATNKFSDSKKLGQGGFGDVYKGILPGGQEVAVKRLSASSGQGMEEFKNEVILIAKLQHRNLVRLVGCCIQGEEKILVYEYMPNKSLDAFLFEKTKQALLDWGIRFNIIEGVARGLLYLHRDSRLRIIHRDLKASNILLDEDMNPKISDFGMARIFGGDQNQANTNRVVGTYGYMSPEYAMEGLFSVKSDVYSFGVLVLEIVSGRRNKILQSSLNIIGEAWRLWSEDRATELIDQSIRSSNSTHQMVRCIHIALLCVQDHATDRPDMASAVLMLGSESANLPTPNEPKFLLLGSANKKENVVNESESFSANNVAITVVEGR